jgi:GT2 family glycosyltransferase
MLPDLSVVIPTHERPEKLRRTLHHLEAQTDAPSFEVVVTINPGDDLPAVTEVTGMSKLPIEVLEAELPGVSASRNRGWRHARAPLVLFLGDDILASPTLLAEHLEWHRGHPEPEVGVLGRVRWAGELDISPFMRWLEWGLQFDFRTIQGIEAGPGRLYTSNVSLKRGLLQRVGGFDERFTWGYEDIELGYRLSKIAGFRLLYNDRAVAEHLHETSLEAWKERMRISAHAERMLTQKHPELEAQLHMKMQAAATAPRARGRAAKLVSLVPPWVPVLGPLVWGSAQQRWLQALAPSFLAGWEEASDRTRPTRGAPTALD